MSLLYQLFYSCCIQFILWYSYFNCWYSQLINKSEIWSLSQSFSTLNNIIFQIVLILYPPFIDAWAMLMCTIYFIVFSHSPLDTHGAPSGMPWNPHPPWESLPLWRLSTSPFRPWLYKHADQQVAAHNIWETHWPANIALSLLLHRFQSFSLLCLSRFC